MSAGGPESGPVNRSVSSAGERQSSEHPSAPAQPQRAKTFGGFDQPGQQLAKVDENAPGTPGPPPLPPRRADSAVAAAPAAANPKWLSLPTLAAPAPPLLSLDAPDQQRAAVHVTHYLNNVLCMVSEHFTSLESLKAEVTEVRERSSVAGGRYRQNQLLEELRLLQDSMAKEKVQWQLDREAAEQDMLAKRKDLARTQLDVERGLKDVKEQRDQLYRKLDLLKAQGIEILGPNMSVLKTSAGGGGQDGHLHHAPPANELFYYSEDRAADLTGVKSQSASPTGTVNLGSSSSLR